MSACAHSPKRGPPRMAATPPLTKRESVTISTAPPAKLAACTAAASSARCAVCMPSTGPQCS
eukprot:2794073-Alexandrium_andersonii.AAC.1